MEDSEERNRQQDKRDRPGKQEDHRVQKVVRRVFGDQLRQEGPRELDARKALMQTQSRGGRVGNDRFSVGGRWKLDVLTTIAFLKRT